MNRLPDFLPPIFDLSGNWEQKVEELYDLFLNDFVFRECNYENLKIVVNRTRSIDDKEDGFWHLISKEDKKEGRIPDFRRAERIRWIRALIENHTHSEIKEWDYLEGSGRTRKYLWLHNFDFVVILELCRSKTCYFLVTAFFVERYKKRDLEKRFQKRTK